MLISINIIKLLVNLIYDILISSFSLRSHFKIENYFGMQFTKLNIHKFTLKYLSIKNQFSLIRFFHYLITYVYITCIYYTNEST